MTYVDRTLNCVDCGVEFVHSAADQEHYAAEGVRVRPEALRQLPSLSAGDDGRGAGPRAPSAAPGATSEATTAAAPRVLRGDLHVLREPGPSPVQAAHGQARLLLGLLPDDQARLTPRPPAGAPSDHVARLGRSAVRPHPPRPSRHRWACAPPDFPIRSAAFDARPGWISAPRCMGCTRLTKHPRVHRPRTRGRPVADVVPRIGRVIRRRIPGQRLRPPFDAAAPSTPAASRRPASERGQIRNASPLRYRSRRRPRHTVTRPRPGPATHRCSRSPPSPRRCPAPRRRAAPAGR